MSTFQVSRYHPALVALHWALAALIIADLTIGTLVLRHLPNNSAMKLEALRAHMSGGLVILTLMLVRLGVRATAAVPAEAPTGSSLLDRVAWLSHRMLYVAVFGMAGSGLIMALQAHVPDVVFFGGGKLPASFWEFSLRGAHYFFARLLMALIALHIAGALYHTFIRRDHLLRRMWFGARKVGDAAAAGAAVSATYGSATFWRYAPWLTRVILAAPTLLFILIGWSYMGQPLQTTAKVGDFARFASRGYRHQSDGRDFPGARGAHAVRALLRAAVARRTFPGGDRRRFCDGRADPRHCCRRRAARDHVQAGGRIGAADAVRDWNSDRGPQTAPHRPCVICGGRGNVIRRLSSRSTHPAGRPALRLVSGGSGPPHSLQEMRSITEQWLASELMLSRLPTA